MPALCDLGAQLEPPRWRSDTFKHLRRPQSSAEEILPPLDSNLLHFRKRCPLAAVPKAGLGKGRLPPAYLGHFDKEPVNGAAALGRTATRLAFHACNTGARPFPTRSDFDNAAAFFPCKDACGGPARIATQHFGSASAPIILR
jgi:hypothetical protein